MKLLLTIPILLMFAGCSQVGYESYEECMLREIQKCSPVECGNSADYYCQTLDFKEE